MSFILMKNFEIYLLLLKPAERDKWEDIAYKWLSQHHKHPTTEKHNLLRESTKDSLHPLTQRFPTGGPRTTGGPRQFPAGPRTFLPEPWCINH